MNIWENTVTIQVIKILFFISNTTTYIYACINQIINFVRLPLFMFCLMLRKKRSKTKKKHTHKKQKKIVFQIVFSKTACNVLFNFYIDKWKKTSTFLYSFLHENHFLSVIEPNGKVKTNAYRCNVCKYVCTYIAFDRVKRPTIRGEIIVSNIRSRPFCQSYFLFTNL